MSPGRGFDLTPRDGPAHAGVGATFCGRPLVHEASGLEGVDVAVLGAPFDDGTVELLPRVSAWVSKCSTE